MGGGIDTDTLTEDETMTNRETYEEVTNRILDGIEQTDARTWKRPWNELVGFPRNAACNRPYSGINVLLLWGAARKHGYDSNRWLTYNQADKEGGHVKKGESGEKIVFWKMKEIQIVVDEDGREIENVDPEDVDEDDDLEVEEKTIPLCKLWTVFNIEQTTLDAEEYDGTDQLDGQAGELVETLLDNCPAEEVKIGDHRPRYNHADEILTLPDPSEYDNEDDFISSACHEMVHSTANLRGRETGTVFGGKKYAREELVAEIGAAFLCAELGVKSSPKSESNKYVRHWVSAFEDDEYAVLSAAKEAEKSVDLLKELAGLGEYEDDETDKAA